MKIKSVIIALAAITLAACNNEPFAPGAEEQGQYIKLIIPEPGAGTRLTNPDDKGHQKWTDFDRIELDIAITTGTAGTVSIQTHADYKNKKWVFEKNIPLPVDATAITIRAGYYQGFPLDTESFEHDMLISHTTVTYTDGKMATDAITLEPFQHVLSRITFTGFTEGEKIWLNASDKWGTTAFGYDFPTEPTPFADNDHLRIYSDATLYAYINAQGTGTCQYTVTDAGTTERPGPEAEWRTITIGQPNTTNGTNYYNRTYEVINPTPNPTPGGYNEAEWNSAEQAFNDEYDYIVKDYDDLIALRDAVNTSGNIISVQTGTTVPARTAKVAQVAHITMPDDEVWVPIGKDGNHYFQGVYNGGGYTITGLETAEDFDGHGGLFGIIQGDVATPALIAHVHLRNCQITATGYAGALAGCINNTRIAHCTATGTVTGNEETGGLVGYTLGNSTITHSNSACKVTSNNSFAGGLVGRNSSGNTFAACRASGTVTGATTGGLVGGNYGTIYFCYATGQATGSYAGGLVGSNGTNGTIHYCYATGTATGSISGTFAGLNSGAIAHCHAPGTSLTEAVGWNEGTADITFGTGNVGSTVAPAGASADVATIVTTGYKLEAQTVTLTANEVWNNAEPPRLAWETKE